MNELEKRYQSFLQSTKTTKSAICPDQLTLVAVSKTKPDSMIRSLYELGQRDFGENYLQEALGKIEALQDLNLTWHYIGKVQRNKTKDLAAHFDWVQTLDRLIIAKRLNAARPESLPPLNVLIQVNIDLEPQKNGCLPEQVFELATELQALENLKLRGLMCIPAQGSDTAFSRMKLLFDQLNQKLAEPMDTLSMGMSADWQQAVEQGSTMIRVGSSLFGERG